MTPEEIQRISDEFEKLPLGVRLELLKKTIQEMVEQMILAPPGPFGGNCSLGAFERR